jgi:hypothetical protein
MKKQKFNGKLRLKKNVISGFNAAQVRGGSGENSCLCDTFDCIPGPTLQSNCTCISWACSLECPSGGPTQHVDCNSGPYYCATELSVCCL